jgi:hypothetical protein
MVQRGEAMALARKRKEEEAQQHAAQQRKATPAPPQRPAQAPASRPAPLVWDPATAQAAPAATRARLRSGYISGRGNGVGHQGGCS